MNPSHLASAKIVLNEENGALPFVGYTRHRQKAVITKIDGYKAEGYIVGLKGDQGAEDWYISGSHALPNLSGESLPICMEADLPSGHDIIGLDNDFTPISPDKWRFNGKSPR